MSFFSNLRAWFNALLHHHIAGTLPAAPTAASGPVSLPPIPANAPAATVAAAHAAADLAHNALPPEVVASPVITSGPALVAAAPAQTSTPVGMSQAAVDAVAGWTNGMHLSDVARGGLAYEAIANDPACANWCNLYRNVKDLMSVPAFWSQLSAETQAAVLADCSEAFISAVTMNGVPYANDAGHISQSYAVEMWLDPATQLQKRGINYPDMLSFPCDQFDKTTGKVTFNGVSVSNSDPQQTIQAFIVNCKAAHAAAVAAGEAGVVVLGTLPIISHPTQSVGTKQ